MTRFSIDVPAEQQAQRRHRLVALPIATSNAPRYGWGVIQSFADRDTQQVWKRTRVARFGPDLQKQANRKLLMLDAAETLTDLRVPPGNRLEQLAGTRKGQHSIRINDQLRICFRWTTAGPADVEITDYH